ncbi:mitogen-activated protein kinase kinase kinase 14-like isoform X2 [Heterodontus francisci]|uniref:mitogen-activated protein kinase kinase kinase 14-like isoform X2 n=1 Tax=Heterodontus francisci TaxID=7792 RepID=UPI00355C2B50
MSEPSQYSSSTTLELSAILNDLADSSPGSAITPECQDKGNEVQTPQIVVDNSCEKHQSSQEKIENTIEKDRRDVNFSKPCGTYTENQTSTLKMKQQPYHRNVKRFHSCPTQFQQPQRNEDADQLLTDFYRESLLCTKTDHWLDLIDSESNYVLYNTTPYWSYLNDVDAGIKVMTYRKESEISQKTTKSRSQEKVFRNVFRCENEINKNREDQNNQNEEPSVKKNQRQAYDYYSEGKDWQPICPLGYGKFGEVTLVYDKNKKVVCAAKKVSKKHYRQEELEIWSSLNAVNIVQLFGAVSHGDCVIFFMELVNGGTLSGLIKRKHCLSHKVAIKYFKMVLDALDYLHRCSIIHNDVKGDNILLSDTEQQLLLCDFTFAKKLPPGQLTPKGEAPVGTQTHMAPEVAQSAGHDWRADVWSATCTLLHMINGRQPWLKKFGEIHVLYKIVEESPPYFEIPPSCHILVDSLIKRGLMVDQHKRPFAATLRDEAADVLAQISGLQFIFGEQYAEVSSQPCNENMSEPSQYYSSTTLEPSAILKDLADPSPGSAITPECQDKGNEVQTPQIVVDNSCEKHQSSQEKIENTIEKDRRDVNFSKPCGTYTENQTLKINQQPYHRNVKRFHSCPTQFQQPQRNEDADQLLKVGKS